MYQTILGYIDFKSQKILYILLLTGLILRLQFLSPYLEDWDSVQFAIGLHDYSITDHTPHPPGYPLYILMGRAVNFFIQNDLFSLNIISAFLGSLAIIPLYFLVKKIFDEKVALISCLLFLIIPVSWTLSEVALTNIPGQFFLITYAFLLYGSFNNFKRLIFSSFFGGLILGFRFTEFPIILCLLLLTVVRTKNIKTILLSFGIFLTGLLTWVLPVIFITEFNKFIQAYAWVANYIFSHDSLNQQSQNFFLFFKQRIATLWTLLDISYTAFFVIILIASIIYVIYEKRNWFAYKWQFLITWLLSYLVPLVFIYNLEVPRYSLPLAAPGAIIASYFLISISRKFKITTFLILLLIAFLLPQAFSQVYRFKNSTPPTIAPVKYVKSNFSPKKTIIIGTYTYRQFQYYAPEFEVYYGNIVNMNTLNPESVVVIDYLPLKNQISLLKDYQVIDSKKFNGDRDIFARIYQTEVFILQRSQKY